MDLYCAIDLLGGRCVRLWQGDYDQATTYGDDPAAQARAFADAGAPWIHVVDLDAARTGEPTNQAAIAAVVDAVDVPVQVGGGVRSEARADELFAVGVRRVVLGTAAMEDPDLVARLSARAEVAVGLDARGQDVAVRGWEQASGVNVIDAATRFSDMGVSALVVTQIARDGTLEGPDLDGLAAVQATVAVPVIASGGVGSIADLEALDRIERAGRRLAGVIVGRALYEGAVSVSAALAALDGAR